MSEPDQKPIEDSVEQEEGNQDSETGSQEKSSRFDNAKAFFRALNAGADVLPEEFGMKVDAPGATSNGSCASCQMLSEQLQAAEAKLQEIENLYKRMAADFENYRKRAEREREEHQESGVVKSISEILPALDDLDRAQAHFDEASDSRQLFETLKLLYNRFLKGFEQLGIKPIDVIGEPFDPRLHEPVQQVATKEVPEGHVAHELRRGYLLKDKIIRPALVNVAAHSEAAGPEETKAAQPTEEQTKLAHKRHKNKNEEGEGTTGAVRGAEGSHQNSELSQD